MRRYPDFLLLLVISLIAGGAFILFASQEFAILNFERSFEAYRYTLYTAGLKLIIDSSPSTQEEKGGIPTLVVSPLSTVIGRNGAAEFHLEYDPDGAAGPKLTEYVTSTAITWSTSDPALATIDSKGGLAAKKEGVVTVSAIYANMTATSTVTIRGTNRLFFFQTPDGRTRSYRLYIPSSYTGTPTPLVIDYHGGGGNAQAQMNASQLNATADKYGFLVAYPGGTNATTSALFGIFVWNGGVCCSYAMENHIDDVTFTRLMIDDIANRYILDRRRVYAAGLSNGAMLSHRLACEASDVITAIAPVASGLTFAGDFLTCDTTRAVPVIEFHGTTDDYYPFLGGVGSSSISQGSVTSIPETINFWLAKNDIPTSSKTITYQKGIVTCETYTASTPLREVTLCRAAPAEKIEDAWGANHDGGGHMWPRGVRGWPIADIPADFPFNEKMWEFFSRYSL